MRYYLLLLLPLAACGSTDSADPTNLAPNGTISIGAASFTLADWRYRLTNDPNAGSLEMVASNGNTCAMLTDPNAASTRLVYANAFVFNDANSNITYAPVGPGLYPVRSVQAPGMASSIRFWATDDAGQPIEASNQTGSASTLYATGGSIELSTFDPNAPASNVVGSTQGGISNTRFYYTFTAQPCP